MFDLSSEQKYSVTNLAEIEKPKKTWLEDGQDCDFVLQIVKVETLTE